MVLKIDWSDEARADVRRLDKPAAMRVFDALLHLAQTGQGDVKELHGSFAGKVRLRVGDYRIILSRSSESVRILAVKHRSKAYR